MDQTAPIKAFERAQTMPRKNSLILVVAGFTAGVLLTLFMQFPATASVTAPAAASVDTSSFRGASYYAIVIDAGSSGSRVHAFKFNRNAGGSELDIDNFKQLKPGLSSFNEDAEGAARSLRPLLDYAAEKIPASHHKETPIIVRATAGLRMLPGEQSHSILNAVSRFLTKYDFKLAGSDQDVKIMDGEDEGIYAWITINFLLHKIGKPPSHTASTVDLGGGSTQVAYATSAASDTHKLVLAGQTYHIFTHSYLGFGLNTARDKITHRKTDGSSACMPSKTTSPDFATCRAQIQKFIQQGFASVAVPNDLSTPQATHKLSMFAMSFVFDLASQTGLTRQPLRDGDALMLYLSDYLSKAKEICSLNLAQLNKMRPRLNDRTDDPALTCFDLTYIHELLRNGYRRSKDELLYTGSQIEMNNQPVETQWPLGAALMLA